MTDRLSPNAAARLEKNARGYSPNAQLDRLLDTFHNDRAAFLNLPQQVQSQVAVHADFKQQYLDAVEAGVITDDRDDAA